MFGGRSLLLVLGALIACSETYPTATIFVGPNYTGISWDIFIPKYPDESGCYGLGSWANQFDSIKISPAGACIEMYADPSCVSPGTGVEISTDIPDFGTIGAANGFAAYKYCASATAAPTTYGTTPSGNFAQVFDDFMFTGMISFVNINLIGNSTFILIPQYPSDPTCYSLGPFANRVSSILVRPVGACVTMFTDSGCTSNAGYGLQISSDYGDLNGMTMDKAFVAYKYCVPYNG